MPMPYWVEVLERAEEWGLPPWEIVSGGSKTLWILLKRVLQKIITTAQKEKKAHGK